MKWQWILIFICFMGRLLLGTLASSSSSFITTSFLIQILRWIRGSQELSPSYSSSLKGSSLNRERLVFNRSHLLFLCALLPESAQGNHFLLEHLPWMNESHDPMRPFKVVITNSSFSTSSSTTSICSLIWETLVKYDYMVSAL